MKIVTVIILINYVIYVNLIPCNNLTKESDGENIKCEKADLKNIHSEFKIYDFKTLIVKLLAG